ncbi:hypothetical protein ACWDRR_00745 [Kitasatospora sp. NPDC003701]
MSREKRKGTAWESDIVRFLRGSGLDAKRVAQTGRLDVGDIHAPPWVIEAKNVAKIELSSFVDQAEREARHADCPFGVAVVKRRQHGAGKAYAVMTLETLARVMKALADKSR